MNFWLGTHMPSWLAQTSERLMVSRVRLRGRKSFPRAAGPWFLDSGGFSQLSHAQRYGLCPLCDWPLELATRAAQQAWREQVERHRARKADQHALPWAA